MTEYELDLEYEFNLEEETHPDYQVTKKIMEWLKDNMESLTDSRNRSVFSKVNYGYNENTIKGFGKKPVCDVYINELEYSNDLRKNIPSTVNTFIICYLKGNMNSVYLKACELTDYLLQGFEENEEWRELPHVVRNTRVGNVELQLIPGTKTYGVLCAFELEHELY